MQWSKVFAIAKKDWLEVRQNRFAWMPMLILPILISIVLPLVTTVGLPLLNVNAQASLLADPDIADFLKLMPESMQQFIFDENPVSGMITIVLGYMMAPFFLIMPLMVSTIIAAESFAGERERKTVEALLYLPVSDFELFLGKAAAAAIPALGLTWASFILYALIVNIMPYAYFQRIWFPLPTWWPLVLWITPGLVLLGISFTMLISARVKSFMGVYQMSSILVIGVVALFVGQVTGVLYLSVAMGLAVGGLIWGAAIIMLAVAVKMFNRTALLT